MKELSICIVNYNVRCLLESCIRSILDHSEGMKYELIVVDNNSVDNSADMVRQSFSLAKLIVNKTNRGYARAVNQALKRAEGEYVLILNSDTKILHRTLSNTIDFMKANRDAGIVGCRILNPDETLQRSCRSFPSLTNFISENLYLDRLFPRSRFFGRPFMSCFDFNETRKVDVVLGAFMMIRKAMIQQIGLMDDRFFMYAEETDWCYRAVKAGWRIYFYPGAKVIHFGGESVKQNSLSMFIELHKSHHLFIEKYHGNLYLGLVKTVLVVGVFLRVLQFGMIRLLHVLGVRFVESPKDRLSLYWGTLKWYINLKRKS